MGFLAQDPEKESRSQEWSPAIASSDSLLSITVQKIKNSIGSFFNLDLVMPFIFALTKTEWVQLWCIAKVHD